VFALSCVCFIWVFFFPSTQLSLVLFPFGCNQISGEIDIHKSLDGIHTDIRQTVAFPPSAMDAAVT